jgi:hypothetical protein
VVARGHSVLPHDEHVPDLGQGETDGLGGLDEPQPVELGLVVVAIPVRRSRRRMQHPGVLVDPQRVGGHAGPPGQLADPHPYPVYPTEA